MTASLSNAPGMRRKPKQARSQARVNRILAAAEQLFIAEGYDATTTNAIAAHAGVSIGSLYQFFPDKAAIVQALAVRYTELLHQRYSRVDTDEIAALSLSTYVDRMIDTADQFFKDYPGYHAIFMETQGAIPELAEIDAAGDIRLIQKLAMHLSLRDSDSGLAAGDYEAIAFAIVKAIGNLLWLSLSQEPVFQQRLVAEAKRLAFNYLQSYFPVRDNPPDRSARAQLL